MVPDDNKLNLPALFLSDRGTIVGFNASDATRSQLLYSWLRFTGLDKMIGN